MSHFVRTSVAATLVALMPAVASAAVVEVTITNNQAEDGLYLTPLLSIFHDGTYDTFSGGSPASAGVELIAETGNAGVEAAAAQAAGHLTGVITSPGGFAGAPVIDPGETASITIDLDAVDNRYFSFLSMVIPTNDLFIGNMNPMAYELFDDMGAFQSLVVEVSTAMIYDAGTEANNNSGAAFNTAGGDATDTTDNIALQNDLSFLFGQNTADGTTIGTSLNASLATISISQVPLPAALPMLGMALGVGSFVSRRKKRS